MVVKIDLHLCAVKVEDVKVRHCQTPMPFFIAVGEIAVLGIENTIDESEVILDLLIAFDVKAGMTGRGLGLLNSCSQVRHSE